MMKPILITLLISCKALASFEPRSEGARSAALGGAGIALRGDPWCALSNPAAPTGGAWTAGASYEPSPFGLRELSRSAVAVAGSFGFGTIVFSGTRFGFDLYRETSFGISSSIDVAPALRGGAAFRYDRLTIGGYGSAWAVSADVGLLWTPSEELSFGLAAGNVNASTIGLTREKLPQTFGVGVAYSPVQGLLFACDLVKDVRYPPELRCGLEFAPVDALSLRAGVGREPASLGAGAGINLLPVVLNYAFVKHPALGFSHRLGIDLRLGTG